MGFATLPAAAAIVAILGSGACAQEAGAPAPAGGSAGKTTPGAARPTTARPVAEGRQKGRANPEEPGNFGSGLDHGVGSGAGSTGMRGGSR
jgi:hypothetical protein